MKLIKHYANWCQPCKQLSEIMKSVELPEGMQFVENDVDVGQDLAAKHGVRGIPTLVIEDAAGNVLRTAKGSMTKQTLEAFING